MDVLGSVDWIDLNLYPRLIFLKKKKVEKLKIKIHLVTL